MKRKLIYIAWLAFAVIAVFSLHGVKRLEPKFVALGNRHHVMKSILYTVQEKGADYCRQNLLAILPESYRSRISKYQVLSGSGCPYDLIRGTNGIIKIATCRMTNQCAHSDGNVHLGRLSTVDSSDSEEDRYLIGFDHGETLYVEKSVYEVLSDNKTVKCKIDKQERCWALLAE